MPAPQPVTSIDIDVLRSALADKELSIIALQSQVKQLLAAEAEKSIPVAPPAEPPKASE